MPWPRIRFTAGVIAAVSIGYIIGFAGAIVSWRAERWITR